MPSKISPQESVVFVIVLLTAGFSAATYSACTGMFSALGALLATLPVAVGAL